MDQGTEATLAEPHRRRRAQRWQVRGTFGEAAASINSDLNPCGPLACCLWTLMRSVAVLPCVAWSESTCNVSRPSID
jgi:hypothetical protein